MSVTRTTSETRSTNTARSISASWPAGAEAELPAEGRRLVERARDLVPLLSANAAQTERRGRLTEESAGALRDAGLLNLTAPRRFGGHEAGVRTAVEVYAELAYGCGSSAWVSMILGGGAFLAALLGDEARREVWGDDPHTPVAVCVPPTGSTRKVAGGLVVSGRWQPLSGIYQAGWAMLGVPITNEAGEVTDRGIALVPVSDLSIEDTWYVAGMQGTGSNSVVLDQVFVPDHRILSFPRAMSGGYAPAHPDEPLYGVTFPSYLCLTTLAPVLGMARAALQHTMDLLGKGRPIGVSFYTNAIDSPSVQFNVADAASLIDTATMHSFRGVTDVERGLREGIPLDLATRARIRMDIGIAVTRVREAMALLLDVGGASGFALHNPVQRIWRDLETATRHQLLSPGLSREIYGRALLGIEEQVSPLI